MVWEAPGRVTGLWGALYPLCHLHLQKGLPRTHRGICTPSGETGEAERGIPRK